MANIIRNIFAIGDLHIGNKNYKPKKLKGVLAKIKPEDNIIGMGDFCEFINEKSFKYDTQTMSPKKQFKEFKRLFKPFAERGQIIAMIKGNHEDRYFNKIDGLEDWCERYEIPYNGRHILIDVDDKVIYAHHPKTSATTAAGRDRVFKKMRDVQEADIYLTGHFHSLYQDKSYKHNRKRELVSTYFACTGAFLDYRNSYAEEKLYAPNPIGCKKITIKGKKIEMSDFI